MTLLFNITRFLALAIKARCVRIIRIVKMVEFGYFQTISPDKPRGQNVPERVTGTGK